MPPSQKINLKDKIDDGEIDLSMCDLQDVPVKDIANIKNVFSLDLSNNHLITLPFGFIEQSPYNITEKFLHLKVSNEA
ncbi:Leucine rich repeat [Popillia japonica]|uniref:Leucine rich repeat n=1 Tax=Popillia japonica TaxID=7064 RepID=A0AAW1JGD9_POPJA